MVARGTRAMAMIAGGLLLPACLGTTKVSNAGPAPPAPPPPRGTESGVAVPLSP